MPCALCARLLLLGRRRRQLDAPLLCSGARRLVACVQLAFFTVRATTVCVHATTSKQAAHTLRRLQSAGDLLEFPTSGICCSLSFVRRFAAAAAAALDSFLCRLFARCVQKCVCVWFIGGGCFLLLTKLNKSPKQSNFFSLSFSSYFNFFLNLVKSERGRERKKRRRKSQK